METDDAKLPLSLQKKLDEDFVGEEDFTYTRDFEKCVKDQMSQVRDEGAKAGKKGINPDRKQLDLRLDSLNQPKQPKLPADKQY